MPFLPSQGQLTKIKKKTLQYINEKKKEKKKKIMWEHKLS